MRDVEQANGHALAKAGGEWSAEGGAQGAPPSALRSPLDGSLDDPRIHQAMEEYLKLLQEGQRPDRQAFLARYPNVAPALAECLQGLDFVHAAGPELSHPGVPARLSGTGGEEDDVVAPAEPLGDFRIVRELGRGGMGVVYEAVQITLGRRVALKVLPFAAAMDVKQLQRFKHEAQAAALLHHTNIVPVHYVGCERGMHFYAMQYIEGQDLATLIRHLRQHQQERARPATSEPVTGPYVPTGVPAAPSAETSVPAAAGITTERSWKSASYVRAVARLGIQAADALEHAHELGVVHRDIKPANLLLDVRDNLWITDFGLAHLQGTAGLTVTGDLVGTLRYMSPEQAVAKRVLVDHRTDVYSLGVTLYELLTLRPAFAAEDRQELLRQIAFDEPTPPCRLNRAIQRELETIVLKAAAKNPAERYATAQELADDLRRFLEHRPIRARRPTLRQRAQSWARRNPAAAWSAAISTVVLLLTSVVALGVSNFFIGQERDQKDLALEHLGLEKQRADDNLARARTAVKDYLTKVAADPRLKAGDFQALRKDLVTTAVPFCTEFVRQEQDEPALEAERGRVYLLLASVRHEIGEHAQALDDFGRARVVFAQLTEDFPAVPEYRGELGTTHNNMGLLLNDLGKRTAAEKAFRQALTIQEKLAADFPAVPDYRMRLAVCHLNLGKVLAELGKPTEAEAAYQQALVIQEKLAADFPTVPEHRRPLALSHNNLGKVLSDLGKRMEAEAAHRRALAIQEKLAADFPAVPDYRMDFAVSHNNLGVLLHALGKRAEAEAASRQALAIRKKLAADFPTVPQYRHTLAGSHWELGKLLHDLGKHEEAQLALRQALAIHIELAEDFPTVPDYRNNLALDHNVLGLLLRNLGKRAEAGAAYRQAVAIQKKLAVDFPTVPNYRHNLAQSLDNLGNVLNEPEKRAEAEAAYRQALTIREKLAADFPSVPDYRNSLANSYTNLGAVFVDLGKRAEAKMAFRQDIAIQEKLVADFPSVPEYRYNLAISYHNLGAILSLLGKGTDEETADQETAHRKALAIQEKLAADFPTVPKYRNFLAIIHNNLGAVLNSLGKPAEAQSASRQALAIQERLAADFPTVVEYRMNLATMQNGLAWRLATCLDERFRDPKQAVASARKALALAPSVGGFWNTLGVAHYRNGEWQPAVAALKKSMEIQKGGDASDWFFLAMAHWQLGDKEQAKKWYDKAAESMDKNQAANEELLRFRAEAEQLLGVPKRKLPAKNITK